MAGATYLFQGFGRVSVELDGGEFLKRLIRPTTFQRTLYPWQVWDQPEISLILLISSWSSNDLGAAAPLDWYMSFDQSEEYEEYPVEVKSKQESELQSRHHLYSLVRIRLGKFAHSCNMWFKILPKISFRFSIIPALS